MKGYQPTQTKPVTPPQFSDRAEWTGVQYDAIKGEMMKRKPIDPIAIKQAIKDGQLVCFEKKGRVYIQDGMSGDCVCVLNLMEVKEDGNKNGEN